LQITMDEEFIYLLTDFYSVVRIPKFEGGGGARILNMDYLGFPLDMAMDDDFLYVLDVAYLRVLAFPKEGGAATVIFHNGIDPNDPELVWGDSLTIDGDFLYVADIDRI
ncbi:MAG TPA: hypothetical protein DF383_06855, partial [Deltaproteobacteria bacterium]|nr:hypothetical protein [Deltaproteobacteria bacterium]